MVGVRVTVDDSAAHTLLVGLERWVAGITNMPGRALHHGYEFKNAQVVAGARWLDGKTLEMTWIYPQTAFRDRVEAVRQLQQSGVVISCSREELAVMVAGLGG